MTVELGQTPSHFRSVKGIGHGGWGVVDRALDDRPRRDLALNVLPPDLLPEPQVENATSEVA